MRDRRIHGAWPVDALAADGDVSRCAVGIADLARTDSVTAIAVRLGCVPAYDDDDAVALVVDDGAVYRSSAVAVTQFIALAELDAAGTELVDPRGGPVRPRRHRRHPGARR